MTVFLGGIVPAGGNVGEDEEESGHEDRVFFHHAPEPGDKVATGIVSYYRDDEPLEGILEVEWHQLHFTR